MNKSQCSNFESASTSRADYQQDKSFFTRPSKGLPSQNHRKVLESSQMSCRELPRKDSYPFTGFNIANFDSDPRNGVLCASQVFTELPAKTWDGEKQA